MNTQQIKKIQLVSNMMAQIYRKHYLAETNRHENNSEHSLAVALLCMYYHHTLNLTQLSETKVIYYALVHDIVEIYAGDVRTHSSPEVLRQKEIDEQRSLERLQSELSFDQNLVNLMTDYQNHVDDEAMFVWACDKIQAYTQGELDNWRPYREYALPKNEFIEKLEEQIAKTPGFFQTEFRKLANHWIDVYPNSWDAS